MKNCSFNKDNYLHAEFVIFLRYKNFYIDEGIVSFYFKN